MKLQWERHAAFAFRAKSETGDDWIMADLGGGCWACARRDGQPGWLVKGLADAFTADKFCQAVEDMGGRSDGGSTKLQWERCDYGVAANSRTGGRWLVAKYSGDEWWRAGRSMQPQTVVTGFASATNGIDYCQIEEDRLLASSGGHK